MISWLQAFLTTVILRLFLSVIAPNLPSPVHPLLVSFFSEKIRPHRNNN